MARPATTRPPNVKAFICVGIAAFIASVAIAVWTTSPRASYLPSSRSSAASYQEALRNAHMEHLPVQEMEDQTFVYSRASLP